MRPLGRCRDCRGRITKWKTGRNDFEGLSGDTCPCGKSHTIDQYPDTIQTRNIRRRISRRMNTSRFRELDWVKVEERLRKYEQRRI